MKNIKSIFILLFVFALITVYMLESGFSQGKHISEKYITLTNNIINIKLNLTYSHLWLEEILAGDADENIKDTLTFIDRADNLSHIILDELQVNKNISPQLNKLIVNIQKFRGQALYRYEHMNIAYSGTQLDKDYDVLFRTMMDSADRIEEMIEIRMQKDLDEYNNLKVVLIAIFVLLFFISVMYIYLTEKRRVLFLKDIEKKNNNLIATQKDLQKSISLFGENVVTSNTDLDGLITYVSPAFCQLSGYEEVEITGKPHNLLRNSEMSDSFFRDMWESIKQGKEWRGDIKNTKKDGEFYWVDTTILPIYNHEEKLIGYTSIRHDITAKKIKEEFMANMSHELRTPLNAIMGFSSILNKKITDDNLRALSKQIYSSSSNLLKLINDILDLSKIENANFKIDKYEFYAYDSILNHSHQFEGLTHDSGVDFDIEIDDNLKATFLGDWNRISQVVLNLISNSIKFTAKDGFIRYSTQYKDGNIIIIVKDTGIGMSDAVKDKIFKPFEQADGSITRKYGGTGLGLSITQNLVELMHGKIEVDSQEGYGSTFIVSLPLEKLNAITKTESVKEEYEDKENTLSGHILIAEDNKTNQMLVKMMIEEFGLTCDIANDGVEATKIYSPKKHKLILMDENMPNMSGVEAMKEIRKKYKDKCNCVIALTANAMEGDRERFLKEGMDGYISKPIDEDLLYRVLKHSIETV